MATAKMKIATPVGDLKYVFITGKGKENYDQDGHDFTASVVLPKKEGEALYEKVTKFFKENRPSGNKQKEPANAIIRPIEGDKKNVLVSFKTNTTFTDEDGTVTKSKVKVKNSKGQERELPEGVGVGDGSRGAIAGTLAIYGNKKKAGVSMFLNTVQITKFVEYKDDDGLESQDDGDFDDFEGTSKSDFPTEEEKPKKDKKKNKKKNKD